MEDIAVQEIASPKVCRFLKIAISLKEGEFLPFNGSLVELRLRYMKQQLLLARGDKKIAAHRLGIGFCTVYRKLAILDSVPLDQKGFLPYIGTLAEIEAHYIKQVLLAAENDKEKAASMLGVCLKALYNKLHKYNIAKPKPQPTGA